jgi:ribosomal protein L7/L12
MTQDSFDEELRELLASGNKIQAIKLYREETGVGLAEAKNAVEEFAAGEALPAAGGDLQGRIPVDDPDLVAEVTTLLQEGKGLPAIKLVRVRTGVALKEAKEIVDRISEDAGLLAQSGSGCMGMILLGIFVPPVLARLLSFA